MLTWQAPRRFDLVHTALDHASARRRRESVERALRELATPNGRVVLLAERVRAGEPDLVQQVSALGLKIGGVLESIHPTPGELRRSVWIGAGGG